MTQTYRVQLFAKLRDAFATDLIETELPSKAAVGELRQMLMQRQPAVAGLLERSRIAVNGEFVTDDRSLRADDEIAVIPPVSGG